MHKKELVMILVLGMFCFSFVSASNLLTKIDFEVSGFSGIDSLNNSDGESVIISIFNSSGVVVSRNAVTGVYLPNMTITMSGAKFNLSYSTDYTYNLSTVYGDFLYNFTTPAEANGASILTTWNDSKDYFVVGNTTGGSRTVIDTQNNLMWQDGKSATILSYDSTYGDGAMEYCDGLVWSGYDDWRLPNVGEFMSLIKYSYGGSFFPNEFVDKTTDNSYWTSTINPAFTDSAYIVNMDCGRVGDDIVGPGAGSYDARCVRP